MEKKKEDVTEKRREGEININDALFHDLGMKHVLLADETL